MDKFSSEISLRRCRDCSSGFEVEYEVLVSSIEYLDNYADFKFDLYDELLMYKEIESLPDGDYFIYMNGEVFYEKDVDWESGIDEGGYIFNVLEFIIKDGIPIDERDIL